MVVQSKQKGKRGDIVALKGKTTFELTDVNTGEVEVIEDSNMITNGLQEFLTTYGYFGCDVLSKDKMGASSLWVNALGGLFLFDSRLEENVKNTFMPAGVKMIGNGSKDAANSGVVTELGSYNTTESGLQSDGSIKLVYDFSTQQANGTIACVCLTSKLGGYIGMGNESGRILNADYNFGTFVSDDSHLRLTGTDGELQDRFQLLYPSYEEDAIYFTNPYNIKYNSSYASQHWSVTKKIQILKVRAGFKSLSIKDTINLKSVVSTYDVDIPQDILDYMGTNTNYTYSLADIDGNVYIVFYKNDSDDFSNGSFFWIMKIDREMKVTIYKFTNNTGKRLYADFNYVCFDGDYIWMLGYDSPYYLYGIKYADSTQIIETGVSKGSRHYIFPIERNLLLIFDKFVNGSTGYYAPTVYDVINRTHTQLNGVISSMLGDAYSKIIPFIDRKGVYILMYGYNSLSTFKYMVLKDPRYLATINNLSEPVVKTASKTMKVTYTITEA